MRQPPRPAASAPQASAPTPAGALRQAWRGLFWAVVLFSTLVNLLMLTGPLFMMQVYDRVLASRSEATLIALFGLTAFLYAMMVLLDHARAQLVARVGARLAQRLEAPVFAAVQRQQLRRPNDPAARAAAQDLDLLQRWLASPAFLAMFDAPWTPMFLVLIWLFHPVLGLLALAGAGILVALAMLNQVLVRGQLTAAAEAGQAADRLGEALRTEAPVLTALGMQDAAFARWRGLRDHARQAGIAGGDLAAFFAAATKGMRLFLQSAMLAAGAWLVLRGQMGAGAMIAASIILGRALAPVELAVGQWGSIQAARAGWRRLGGLLAATPAEPARLRLPRPAGALSVQDLVVVPPGEMRAVLREVSFAIAPGTVLGVVGPSGAGKSSLARALVGAWPAVAGAVRLDGLALEAYAPRDLGAWIGYLPQRISLIDGTISENIARLRPDAAIDGVLEAARRAGAHEMIMSLPQGYDTRVSGGDSGLSGGQLQRVGLARALYGDPVLVVLDEPDANLDRAGMNALTATLAQLRLRGTTTVLVAHRAETLAGCDRILSLAEGRILEHATPTPATGTGPARGGGTGPAPTTGQAGDPWVGAAPPIADRVPTPGQRAGDSPGTPRAPSSHRSPGPDRPPSTPGRPPPDPAPVAARTSPASQVTPAGIAGASVRGHPG